MTSWAGLTDQHLDALARLADAALAERDWHACLRWAPLILDQNCCPGDAFGLLLLAHARLGQPSRVRRWLEVYRTTVVGNHLDCEPSPENGAAARGRPAQWSLPINSCVTRD